VDEPTGFDKNRGAIFGRRGLAATVRSEAEDERPSPAASNPTLSATLNPWVSSGLIDGWTRRVYAGVRYDRIYSRKCRGPYAGRRVAPERTLYAEIGYSGTALGANQNDLLVTTSAAKGWQLSEHAQLFFANIVNSRVEGGSMRNTRSGLGNVLHVDVAFPLQGDHDISKAQLLVETKASY